MTPPNIPLWYRFWHLYFEPLCALGGVWHLTCAPAEYFTYMPSGSSPCASSQIAYDQLATMYLFFALIEGGLLRVVDDMRTWRWIVAALAMSDAGHCVAAWRMMGTAWMLSPGVWDQKDWVTNVLNFGPLITRLAFLAGVGFGKTTTGTAGKSA